jgi:hypothetical protein
LYLEHAREFIDQPGEWYLDRATGILTYQAQPGTDPNDLVFMAPVLAQLLKVEGTYGNPVKNLHFAGIHFKYTNWQLPDFGYTARQAHMYVNPSDRPVYTLTEAVECNYVEDCSFVRCAVAHTGANGLGFIKGCKDSKILYCHIYDTGGNGITVGDVANTEANPDLPDGNMDVSHNIVNDCGKVIFGAVGIWEAFVPDTRITHNHVYNLPLGGITIGWRWDDTPSNQRNVLVEKNHVHDVMRTLYDNAAIYTLGNQPGTIIQNNLIHHSLNGNGMQHDNGSSNFIVRNNIIWKVGHDVCQSAYVHDIVWENNIAAFWGRAGVTRMQGKQLFPGLPGAISHTFKRNIYFADNIGMLGIKKFTGSLMGRNNVDFDNNIYWKRNGGILTLNESFKAWQAAGKDQHSRIVDPLFVDPDNGDFRFRAESPALQLGFKPIDMSEIGPIE